MEDINSLNLFKNNLCINNLLDGSGFVKVIKVSPETHPEGYTPEYIIAQAARCSYGNELKSAKADKALIEYLFRHQHTSPFEMCNITFCLKLPIAICRQLLRHRTGKFNEFSQRYSEVTEEVNRLRLDKWEEGIRGKSNTNKQASEDNLDKKDKIIIKKKLKEIENLQDKIYDGYKELLNLGLTREVSRFVLPLSTYTTIYVQFDLNNLIKFFNLRCANDAQYEIQIYAKAMRELAKNFFPITINTHLNYTNGIWLGEYELRTIKENKVPEEITSKSYKKQLEKLLLL